MTVRRWSALGFGVLLVFIAVTGVVSTMTLRTLAARKDDLATSYAATLSGVERARFRAEQVVTASRGYLLTGDEHYIERFNDARQSFEGELKRLRDSLAAEDLGLIDSIQVAGSNYIDLADHAMRRRKQSGNADAVIVYFEDVLRPSRELFEARLDDLVQRQRQLFRADYEESRHRAMQAEAVIMLTTFLALVFGVVLGAWVVRRLAELFLREQRAVADAAKAAAAREEVLAVVSHDLRSPLGAILMSSERAAEMAEGEPTLGRLIEVTHRAAERMRHLIEEVLDVARIDASTMELHKRPCAVASLVADAVRLLEMSAAKKSIRLTAKAVDGAVTVLADSDYLLRVLQNLVSNALVFTPEGGEVEVSADVHGELVHFAVRDTGPGIPRDQIPHLFERHWQAKRAGGGLGLGLYIARSIVELHGGTIGVESAVGKGSVFHFTVPSAGNAMGEAAAPSALLH